MHETKQDRGNGRGSRVYPVDRAGFLRGKIRRLVRNPQKILRPYIREGMTVLDFGCGPGFFTVEMARMVGETGMVVACDVQEGMLERLKDAVHGSEIEKRVLICKSTEREMGVSVKADFVLAFYVIHEIPDPEGWFRQIKSILNLDGRVLVVEPPFHVSRSEFETLVTVACRVGFALVDRPGIFLSKAALFALS